MAGGGEDGIDGVAGRIGKMVAAHAMPGFEMADHRFDGRSAPQFAPDLFDDAQLLSADVDLEAIV